MLGMTGYAKKIFSIQSSLKKDIEVTLEVKSLNNRYLDTVLHLPENAYVYDLPIRQLIQEYVAHARVDFFLTWHNVQANANQYVNMEAAQKIFSELEDLQNLLQIKNPISFTNILSFPVVTQLPSAETPFSWDILKPYCESILKDLQQEQQREGNNTKDNISKLLGNFNQHLTHIQKKAQLSPNELKSRWSQKLLSLQEEEKNLHWNPQRLEQELALQLIRLDLNEELERLNAYVQDAENFLGDMGVNIGKKFDFLCQEMHRECNTIQSKTHNITISQEIIEMKLSIEQIREQLRNVQ